jgi:hypothetical protein
MSPQIADRVREVIWIELYSIHTEDTYVAWLKPYRQEQFRTPWSSAQGVLKSVPQIC